MEIKMKLDCGGNTCYRSAWINKSSWSGHDHDIATIQKAIGEIKTRIDNGKLFTTTDGERITLTLADTLVSLVDIANCPSEPLSAAWVGSGIAESAYYPLFGEPKPRQHHTKPETGWSTTPKGNQMYTWFFPNGRKQHAVVFPAKDGGWTVAVDETFTTFVTNNEAKTFAEAEAKISGIQRTVRRLGLEIGPSPHDMPPSSARSKEQT